MSTEDDHSTMTLHVSQHLDALDARIQGLRDWLFHRSDLDFVVPLIATDEATSALGLAIADLQRQDAEWPSQKGDLA